MHSTCNEATEQGMPAGSFATLCLEALHSSCIMLPHCLCRTPQLLAVLITVPDLGLLLETRPSKAKLLPASQLLPAAIQACRDLRT